MTSTGNRCVLSLAAAVLMMAMLAVVSSSSSSTGGTGDSFSGSPIINYNEAFYIYSVAWKSYCYIDVFDGSNSLICDTGFNSTADPYVSKFEITGGCGPVPSSQQITATLQPNNLDLYCYLFPKSFDSALLVFCDTQTAPSPQFQFSNINPTSDGWLHGNATAVQFSNTANGSDGGFCSALPITSEYGIVQCNRATVSTWETYYFVPV